MKSVYSSLVALVVFVVLAPLAIADPGTTWENQINGPDRFQVLSDFGGAAVLDKETGRVWEQSPELAGFLWVDALAHCYNLQVGGRRGWRLPTIEELASLADTSQSQLSGLPAGNPFNLQSGSNWSATTDANDNSNAWVQTFDRLPFASIGVKAANNLGAWCVRGGQGIDGVWVR